MAKIDAILIPGLIIRESADDGSDFSNPTADYRVLFLGEDGALHLRDSSGTVTDIGGSSTPAVVACRVFSSATQSISDSTITAITFDSENYDTSAIHAGGNPTRMTASATGYWRFTGGTSWDTNTSNLRYLWWRKNGSTEVNGGMVQQTPNAGGIAMFTSVTLSLSATDYIELMCYQTSGGARTIGGTVADIKFESWLEAAYLGS